MSSRELDIVLFGATGVTGVYVVEELHRSSEGLRWGVAGRNADKLRRTLREAAANLGLDEEGALDHVPVIVADVADEESLLRMAKRTRLVLNTVGPGTYIPTLSSVDVTLPPLWSADPALWFIQVESQFAARCITKYHYVVSGLSPSIASEIRDLLLSPPADKLQEMKSEISRLVDSVAALQTASTSQCFTGAPKACRTSPCW
ncbi:hypothetical protein HPB50_002447 [Hyalomma asiaticum]|uniref:Uncharacterized protein n=1 Tax=Hyalomma asiaticum TaxID=266040 RepID=A0ACB7RWH1_HYAAI|nr:hypothetical protein HPB50_002447 [Hyalomma asiaticum]